MRNYSILLFVSMIFVLSVPASWSQTIPFFPFEEEFDGPIDDDSPVTWVQDSVDGDGRTSNGSLVLEGNSVGYGVTLSDRTVIARDTSARARLRLGGASVNAWAGISSRFAPDSALYAGGIQKGGLLWVAERFPDGEFDLYTLETTLSPETHDVVVQLDTFGNTVTVSAWDARDAKPPSPPSVSLVDDTLVEGGFGIGIGGGSQSMASVRYFQIMWALGEFNGDDVLDVADIDELVAEIAAGTNGFLFDLNIDDVVNGEDRRIWVEELKNTFFGDTNLDGQVDAVDLNALALNWQSTTAESWSQGDFNGDRVVNATDLNTVALNWNRGAAANAAVPEPSGLVMFGLGVLGLVSRLRRAGRHHVAAALYRNRSEPFV